MPTIPPNAVVFAVGPVTDTTVPGNSRACVAAQVAAHRALLRLHLRRPLARHHEAHRLRRHRDHRPRRGARVRPGHRGGRRAQAGARASGARPRATRCTPSQAVEGGDVGRDGHRPRAARSSCASRRWRTYWKNREGVAGRGGHRRGARQQERQGGGRWRARARPRWPTRPRSRPCIEQQREPLKTGTKALSTYGTPFLVKPINTLGGARRLQPAPGDLRRRAARSPARRCTRTIHDKDTTCLKCPVACGKQYEIREGELAGLKAKMPEYETIFAFGSMLGNAHAGSLTRANDLCDLLGMDTITMGVTLAFVAEALERGWLDAAEVGVPFGWGDWRGMLRLIEMTAAREGFGDRLAEGAWRLAESVHPEGTRAGLRGQAARAARPLRARAQGHVHRLRHRHARRQPSRHAPHAAVRAGYDRRGTEGKPEFAVRSQHFTAVGDSLVICRFTSERGFGLYVEEPYARMVRAITGWDMTVEELERVGERIINLERLFNVREGVRRAGRRLPWRVMHEPIPEGPSAGMYCPPEELGACSTATTRCAAGTPTASPLRRASARSGSSLSPRGHPMPVTRFEITLRRPLAGVPGLRGAEGSPPLRHRPAPPGEPAHHRRGAGPAQRRRPRRVVERTSPSCCPSTARGAAGACCSTWSTAAIPSPCPTSTAPRAPPSAPGRIRTRPSTSATASS